MELMRKYYNMETSNRTCGYENSCANASHCNSNDYDENFNDYYFNNARSSSAYENSSSYHLNSTIKFGSRLNSYARNSLSFIFYNNRSISSNGSHGGGCGSSNAGGANSVLNSGLKKANLLSNSIFENLFSLASAQSTSQASDSSLNNSSGSSCNRNAVELTCRGEQSQRFVSFQMPIL